MARPWPATLAAPAGVMGAIVRQPALAAALPLLVLLAISLPQPATSPRDAPTGASSQWPRCDECEAVATAIGATLDRQRKPKRKGGGLRELSESVLGELFEDEICIPERYKGYALASEREHMGEVQRLQGPGISWSEGLAPPPPDALLAQLGRRINQRLATRCQDVADGVGLTEIYGMFRYVAERGEEHQAQLCPPGSGGGPIVRTHWHGAWRSSSCAAAAAAAVTSTHINSMPRYVRRAQPTAMRTAATAPSAASRTRCASPSWETVTMSNDQTLSLMTRRQHQQSVARR